MPVIEEPSYMNRKSSLSSAHQKHYHDGFPKIRHSIPQLRSPSYVCLQDRLATVDTGCLTFVSYVRHRFSDICWQNMITKFFPNPITSRDASIGPEIVNFAAICNWWIDARLRFGNQCLWFAACVKLRISMRGEVGQNEYEVREVAWI